MMKKGTADIAYCPTPPPPLLMVLRLQENIGTQQGGDIEIIYRYYTQRIYSTLYYSISADIHCMVHSGAMVAPQPQLERGFSIKCTVSGI
jgi:hypothetical protein